MADPISLSKMLLAPTQPVYWAKSFMIFLGGLVIFGGLALIGFTIYKAFHPIQTDTFNNRAGVINNNTFSPAPRFGCASFQINENYRERAGNRVK